METMKLLQLSWPKDRYKPTKLMPVTKRSDWTLTCKDYSSPSQWKEIEIQTGQHHHNLPHNVQ